MGSSQSETQTIALSFNMNFKTQMPLSAPVLGKRGKTQKLKSLYVVGYVVGYLDLFKTQSDLSSRFRGIIYLGGW